MGVLREVYATQERNNRPGKSRAYCSHVRVAASEDGNENDIIIRQYDVMWLIVPMICALWL